MPTLTIVASAQAEDADLAVVLDAMQSATKVYNGLVWHLRDRYQRTGTNSISRKALNAILKTLPRAKHYYSLAVQATRDEVIQAYRSFFALQQAGRTQHQAPGFRRKEICSPLRYYDGFGFRLDGNRLTLSMGTSRSDGVKTITLTLAHRADVIYRRIVNILLTYDTRLGLRAHLVVEIDALPTNGDRRVAVDLGETQAITAIFEDGTTLLYSGRQIKAIRRYWQKVRSKVRSPTPGQRMSRRYRQIARAESRQVRQLLHLMTTDFVQRCWRAGVGTIAIGDLLGIRERIDYGARLNQRLHAWPFAQIVDMIRYKAALRGMVVMTVDEAYSSQRCHGCGKVRASNRVYRGSYRCACGWQAQADANSAANLFARAFKVSPLRGSGAVAAPVVVPLRMDWHTVYEVPVQRAAC